MEIFIRVEQPPDIQAVQAIVADAFQDHETPELLSALRNSDCWRNLSFIATFQDQPIGHVSFTRGWLDTPKKLIEVLILSPVSVSTIHQRKGIGSKLILESLTHLQGLIEPLVFLEGSPAYYSRLGFQPGIPAGFLKPSVRIPDAAFQYITLPAYESWMTGQLVYPDPFWRMDAVGLR